MAKISKAGIQSNLDFYPVSLVFAYLPLLQLLQFIVSADAINLLHRDIKMKNIFVVQSHSFKLVRLAVGNFRAAQRGEEGVRGAGWVGFSPNSL